MTPPSNDSMLLEPEGSADSEEDVLGRWQSDVSEAQLMSPDSYVASAVVLFFIGFCGFFFNLFVIILMQREKKLWTPINFILFNLVCSDFSVSVLGNPFTLTSSVFRSWIFGRTMCVAYGFFMSLLGITSITTLTVLSFERYIMITKPFHSHHLSPRAARVTVCLIWIYSSCLTVPPLLGWGDYTNEAANISCSVNWEHKNLSTTTYIIFLFVMGLLVPVGVISFSYVNIICTIRQNTLRMGRVTKAETRVAYMIAVMIVAFLLAWMPYAVLSLIIAFGDPTLVSPGLAVVPALVAKSSICYNPVIYIALNTQFQTAFKNLLGITSSRDENCAEVTGISHASKLIDMKTTTRYERQELPSMIVTTDENQRCTTNLVRIEATRASNQDTQARSDGLENQAVQL